MAARGDHTHAAERRRRSALALSPPLLFSCGRICKCACALLRVARRPSPVAVARAVDFLDLVVALVSEKPCPVHPYIGRSFHRQMLCTTGLSRSDFGGRHTVKEARRANPRRSHAQLASPGTGTGHEPSPKQDMCERSPRPAAGPQSLRPLTSAPHMPSPSPRLHPYARRRPPPNARGRPPSLSRKWSGANGCTRAPGAATADCGWLAGWRRLRRRAGGKGLAPLVPSSRQPALYSLSASSTVQTIAGSR